MAWIRREWQLVLMALQFLTRLPVPASAEYEPAAMRRAVRHFPLVGALVGASGAALALAANAWWPPTVAAALAVAGTLWLTTAFHEDGLADTFDALLGAASREKALAIMKDSRIGTYGAAALIASFLLRVLLLAELLTRGPLPAAAALIASHAAGRTAAVALMASLPYARDGASNESSGGTRKREDELGRDLHGAAVEPGIGVDRSTEEDPLAHNPHAHDGMHEGETPAPASADGVAHDVQTPASAGIGRPAAGGIVRDVQPVDAACAVTVGALTLVLASTAQPFPAMIALVAFSALAALLIVLRRWLRRRLAGYTGDTLGAAEQLGELVVLLAFAAQWAR